MTTAYAHVMAAQLYGVSLCGRLIRYNEDDYFVADHKDLLSVYNACKKCREHPDFALRLLAEAGE